MPELAKEATASAPPPSEPPSGKSGRFGDTFFKGLTVTSASLIMAALAGVFLFLFVEGLPGFSAGPESLQGYPNFWKYAGALVLGTVLAAVLALLIAVPFAIAIALFVSHYAPRRLAGPIAFVMDLLAAIPSVVYGLWGGKILADALKPVHVWLSEKLGFIPLFGGEPSTTGNTLFTATIVLAIMIVPIISAISREVFSQTPRLHEEAALALGATRWETIRLAVFPYARSGMVSATMLGLGRALGETMAVAMILSASPIYTLEILTNSNPATIASNIAAQIKEGDPQPLIASGLVLFALTFAVNALARSIAGRGERKMAK